MQQFITVDSATAELILHLPGKVEVRDPNGKRVGDVTPAEHGFTEEDAQIARERLASDQPRYATKEVLQHLQALRPLS